MKRSRFIAVILTLLIASLINSCSSVSTRFSSAEESLETHKNTGMLFHAVLYYPKEVNLKFDGYIIGVEKSPRSKISVPSDITINNDAGVSASNLFNDRKLLYISHIIMSNGEPDRNNNCFIYNAYNQKTVFASQFAEYCDGASKETLEPANAFKNSWGALKQLEKSISDRVKGKKYSHIVVITMGWNTIQEEAIFNFNSIVSNVKAKSEGEFNPLVIGVTWPSQWETPYLPSALVHFVSFPIKARDADELGMSWLGALLHQTIPNATNLPIVVIGHSFGARASSAAVCVGSLIQEGDKYIPRRNINTLINLQGAFRTDRLFGENDVLSKVTYPYGCPNVGTLVLTSSIHDEAVTSHFWGTPYAGTGVSYKKYCVDNKHSEVQCETAQADGVIKGFHQSKRIIYVNTDELIKENAYKTGGGAHSDIYRVEHGEFLNQFVPYVVGRQPVDDLKGSH